MPRRFLLALAPALLAPAAAGQPNGAPALPATNNAIFAPLELPAPNVYRAADGRPGPEYWQQRADYRIAASLDTTSRTLMIEVVADNQDLRVRAGHFARGRLTLDGTHDIMRVPASAVAERAGVFRVFTVERGVATTRVVRVISSTPDTVTIEADLPDGATVVTRPPRTLADGVHVRARASR